jgi:hypothetical protein
MVVASTGRSLVAVSTVASLIVVNVPTGNLVAMSTVGNLKAVNVPAGNLVAANIPLGNMVVASIVNPAALVTIAIERERYALQLSGAVPESCFSPRWGLQCQLPDRRSPGRFRAPWRLPSGQLAPVRNP